MLYDPNFIEYTGTYTCFLKDLTLVHYEMLIVVIPKL